MRSKVNMIYTFINYFALLFHIFKYFYILNNKNIKNIYKI